MVILSFGGGTNGTAMLQGLHERDERLDAILFADTGGERPEIYRHIEAVSKWCESVGYPKIVTVKKGGRPETLEENCHRMKMLPSLAYGFKGCSHKYKIEPQEKWSNNDEQCRAEWKAGRKVLKLIGYDADENHRAKIPEDKKYRYRYPLVEWGWTRDDCVAAIDRMGLPQPGKSACFFCPATKPHEIRQMAVTHPDLMDRALSMEAQAETTHVKGLGRSFRWKDVIATDDMFPGHYIDIDCGCYDG